MLRQRAVPPEQIRRRRPEVALRADHLVEAERHGPGPLLEIPQRRAGPRVAGDGPRPGGLLALHATIKHVLAPRAPPRRRDAAAAPVAERQDNGPPLQRAADDAPLPRRADGVHI